jgi:hypothetical protein
LDSVSASSRYPIARSRISNRPQLLAGVDGRSAASRRYRNLLSSFVASLGGDLNAAEMTLVHTAVSLTLQNERLQGDIAAGAVVDVEQLTRLANAISRTMAALRRRKPLPASPSRAAAPAGESRIERVSNAQLEILEAAMREEQARQASQKPVEPVPAGEADISASAALGHPCGGERL